MLGFKPGFAYLGLVPEAARVPAARDAARPRPGRIGGDRRAPDGRLPGEPRRAAGSSSAGPRCRLFDPWREEPSLIAPGRPRPLRRRSRSCPKRRLAAAAPSPAASAPVAIVREPGLLTTVQDAGRFGHRRLGRGTRRRGRRRRRSPPRTARSAIARRRRRSSARLRGRSLEFLAPVRFAVAGADLGAVLERADLGDWPVPRGASVLARPGNRLRFAGGATAAAPTSRFAGGIDVPLVLGSRSTDLASGFGGLAGRALRAGRPHRACCRRAAARARALAGRCRGAGSVRVRVVLGPQERALRRRHAQRASSRTPGASAATSDRIGLPPRGRAAPPPRRRRDPLRRHGARIDPGPAGRPADRDARRRPDDRRLPEDRDGAHRGLAAPRAAACPGKAR